MEWEVVFFGFYMPWSEFYSLQLPLQEQTEIKTKQEQRFQGLFFSLKALTRVTTCPCSQESGIFALPEGLPLFRKHRRRWPHPGCQLELEAREPALKCVGGEADIRPATHRFPQSNTEQHIWRNPATFFSVGSFDSWILSRGLWSIQLLSSQIREWKLLPE